MRKKRLSKNDIKVLSLSSLGGMLEFYDFIIFAFFTSVISTLFFPPTLDSFWASLNTYGAFAAGYFARPIGGIIMAHFGDKFGRKKMFMLSIMLMVIPTFALGLMPTFESIGYVAPIILLIIRILQGIAIGGELPGAWVFVYEHTPKKHRGFAIGVLTSAVVLGILLGSVVTLIIYMQFSDDEISQYAWRIPFIIGGIFGIISIFLRRYLEETPVFKEMKESNSLHKLPLQEVFKTSKKSFIISMFATWILTGCVVIIVLLIPNFMQAPLNIHKTDTMLMQISAIVFVCAGTIMSGSLSDRFGLTNILAIFSIGLMISNFIFISKIFGYGIIEKSSVADVWIWYCIGAFFVGVVNFTPLVMLGLFKPYIRFSGISASYNIAYAIFGGLTIYLSPIINQIYPIGFGYYLALIGFMGICISIYLSINKSLLKH